MVFNLSLKLTIFLNSKIYSREVYENKSTQKIQILASEKINLQEN